MPDPTDPKEQEQPLETEEEETRPLTPEDHKRAEALARALFRGGDGEEVS